MANRLILAVQLDLALILKLLDSYGKDIHTLEETQIQLGSCRSQLRHYESQSYHQSQKLPA